MDSPAHLNPLERSEHDRLLREEKMLAQRKKLPPNLVKQLEGVRARLATLASLGDVRNYEPQNDPIVAPEALRQTFDVGLTQIFERIPDIPSSEEDHGMRSLRELKQFRRDRVRWAELQGDAIVSLEDGVIDNAWMIVIPSGHRLAKSQREMLQVNTTNPTNYLTIKSVAITPKWAGIGGSHEAQHLYDFATGREPRNPNRRQYLEGEERAYSTEMTAATLLSNGQFLGALDAVLTQQQLHDEASIVALRQDFPKLVTIARELDKCITEDKPLSGCESSIRLGFYIFALAFRKIDVSNNEATQKLASKLAFIDRMYQGFGPSN